MEFGKKSWKWFSFFSLVQRVQSGRTIFCISFCRSIKNCLRLTNHWLIRWFLGWLASQTDINVKKSIKNMLLLPFFDEYLQIPGGPEVFSLFLVKEKVLFCNGGLVGWHCIGDYSLLISSKPSPKILLRFTVLNFILEWIFMLKLRHDKN